MAKENKPNYLWIGMAVVAVIILAIVFISNSNKNVSNEVTCNSPYIKVGTSCCLDQNSNNVCDNDEQPTQTQQEQQIKSKIGETCVANWDCESNFCLHPQGATTGTCKDECDYTIIPCDSSPCTLCNGEEGFCVMSECKAEKRPNGQSCTKSSDCESDLCYHPAEYGDYGLCKAQ